MNFQEKYKPDIWLFNLETNLDSKVLAAAHDWVDEFAKQAKTLFVVSTHVGRVNLPDNVSVLEIGGGTLVARLIAIKRLVNLLPTIWRTRHQSIVFHHMSPKTVLILGLPIRMMKIPQGLWYSHSKFSMQFRIARSIVNFIFTSMSGTAPGKSSKYRFIGHGISENRFNSKSSGWEKVEGNILFVGRVSPVKRIEELLKVVAICLPISNSSESCINIVGPFNSESSYLKSLLVIAEQSKIKIELIGPVSYFKIPEHFRNADFFYSGTPASVDKAVMEAGLSGCLILSTSQTTLELTGMHRAWTQILHEEPGNLQNQLSILSALHPKKKDDMRDIVRLISTSNSRLSQTIARIVAPLEELKSADQR